jgi:hypothetical protein
VVGVRLREGAGASKNAETSLDKERQIKECPFSSRNLSPHRERIKYSESHFIWL